MAKSNIFQVMRSVSGTTLKGEESEPITITNRVAQFKTLEAAQRRLNECEDALAEDQAADEMNGNTVLRDLRWEDYNTGAVVHNPVQSYHIRKVTFEDLS